jgi:CRISPR/Cas system-associated protein Cas10 (large subunit of type III CRISPR-Cas system)
LEIDYPVSISEGQGKRIKLSLKGCSFCDVAADKGFFGKLDRETVISQIHCLPEAEDGRKIPFELINESPLPTLPDLLKAVSSRGIKLSQINLTLRADWLVAGIQHLTETLRMAAEMGVYVLLSSIGFESFDDTLLKNLNKGLSAKENVDAIRHIRQLKEKFRHQLGYSTQEGAIHGFIHPTPWDTQETAANIQKNIVLYGLQNDILPPHSTPLIIHHASGLGDWIREIEGRERLRFKRLGSIIGWWDRPQF